MSQNQYEEMIRTMPPGLDRAILRALEYHRGKPAAIGGGELTENVNRLGFHVENRTIREAIKELRRAGQLILSSPGEKGGYYLAIDASETEEFFVQEFEAKISDMSETLRAMQRAAREQFGSGVQGRLF